MPVENATPEEAFYIASLLYLNGKCPYDGFDCSDGKGKLVVKKALEHFREKGHTEDVRRAIVQWWNEG